MTQEDIKKKIMKEFDPEIMTIDEMRKYLSQALDTAFGEWSEVVRMERKEFSQSVRTPKLTPEQEAEVYAYNEAVDKLNKKLQELGE